MECASASCYSSLSSSFFLNSPRILPISHLEFLSSKFSCSLNNGDSRFAVTELSTKSIRSTSNSFVKHCVKLRQSYSYRHSHGSVLVVGATLIREIYEFHLRKEGTPTKMDCIFLLDETEVPLWLDGIPVDIVRVNSLVMKKLAGVQSTESIEAIALMRIPSSFVDLNESHPDTRYKTWFHCPHRILVLEGIQDPGNLGALLRSAMAFRWDGVFLLPGCCDPFNEKSLRASRGVAFQIPVVSGQWRHLNSVKAKMLAGHPDGIGGSKPVARLTDRLVGELAEVPVGLVLGSEGGGLSEEAKKVCELVSIPMADEFESLNVAVAGGIFMFMLQQGKQVCVT